VQYPPALPPPPPQHVCPNPPLFLCWLHIFYHPQTLHLSPESQAVCDEHQAGARWEAARVDVPHQVVHEHSDAVIHVRTRLAIGEPVVGCERCECVCEGGGAKRVTRWSMNTVMRSYTSAPDSPFGNLQARVKGTAFCGRLHLPVKLYHCPVRFLRLPKQYLPKHPHLQPPPHL
jgi:hypothetical protein